MTGTPDRTLAEILRGNIDLASDTLRIALFDDSTAYTFDNDAHEFVADILDSGTTAQELSGSSGYTGSTDRQTLTSTTVTEDNVDNEGAFDAADVTWSSVNSTADIQGWIIYKQVGADDTTPADDPVILVVDDDMTDAPSNLPLPTNGSDIQVAFDPEGVLTQEVA